MSIAKLKSLSTKITKEDRVKFDKIHDEILYPMFERYTTETKSTKIRITDNSGGWATPKRDTIDTLLKELYPVEYPPKIQRLIETSMKPYLIEKGYNVHIWEPRYSVEVSW